MLLITCIAVPLTNSYQAKTVLLFPTIINGDTNPNITHLLPLLGILKILDGMQIQL